MGEAGVGGEALGGEVGGEGCSGVYFLGGFAVALFGQPLGGYALLGGGEGARGADRGVAVVAQACFDG